MRATEQLTYEQALAYLPQVRHRAEAVLRRLREVAALPAQPRVLDVGSAQGNFLIACAAMGYDAVGVEPWAQARAQSAELARGAGIRITVLDGSAEELPLMSGTFDIVHANAVIEHVSDVRAAFAEAYRVLKPGGVFWFSAANALCPAQSEIRGFPAFSWYPGAAKEQIMRWAAEHRPELIGHTTRPALNWFTPWRARRDLARAGFSKVYDRWDLRLADEGGRRYALALRVIKTSAFTKLLADVAVSECSYAAIK